MTVPTTVQRKSDREHVASCELDAPSALVYRAWTEADLFGRWWVPKSFPISLRSCELDVRVGGKYRLVFSAGEQTAEFFGKYLEVTPGSRIVWTNDEGGEGAGAVTTVTLEARGGNTLIVMHDLHPSKEALDEAVSSGSTSCIPETFTQLDELLRSLRA